MWAGMWQYPGGGLTGWLPVYPAFTVLSAPIPPAPFPAGRGRIIVFLCKGLRPLHPRGWEGSGTGGGWKVVFDRMACPRNRARTLGYGNNNSFGKVLGGSGDSFKSPPAYLRRHAGAQEKAGTGHERRVTAAIIRSGKFWGGSGDSFKSPPAHPRISPYLRPPYPPPALCKKEGTAHEGRFRGMITRRSDRSARCPAPGSSGRRHTG